MLNTIMPMVALRDIVIFPYMVLNFQVGRPASMKAVERAMVDSQTIFLIPQKDMHVEDPFKAELCEVGVVAEIRQVVKVKGDTLRVLAEGKYRAVPIDITEEDGCLMAEIEQCVETHDINDIEMTAHMRTLVSAFDKYAASSNRISPEMVSSLENEESPSKVSDIIAASIMFKTDEKQEFLVNTDAKERITMLLNLINRELEIIGIENDINRKVKVNFDKLQREQYMREQIHVIREKLGEDNSSQEEIDEFKRKIEELPLDDNAKKRLQKDISKLSIIPQQSPDYSVLLTYLETVLSMPWNTYTEDDMDLPHARKILDEDHYGMEKVKERVLEYLAVRKLKNDMRGPILCFAGPPGVGKTSIARSIARALGRKFVRISLGGVHDEAEIRGHRRTYVGAIPGRIAAQIKQAGTMNPVFLLDEIDKMASDFRGDPTSAMLEVLDPEINSTYTDHYLDVELDLSRVMFLTTANDVSRIPAPLYDRMEVIDLTSYTEYEKLKIAEKHLVPKQINEHALPEGALTIKEDAIKRIINEYTAESGVRSLEREIAAVCRKAALKLTESADEGATIDSIVVSAQDLKDYLGIPKYTDTGLPTEDKVGVAIGLAWTAVGGQTMTIEVSVVEGTGKIELTGQLGDVMKESAMTGISLVRANASKLKIDKEFYKNIDLHVHVPEGAVPKDGPSAGITIALAVVSALTKRKIRSDIAMTGEITLTGRVLPIGGLKEKTLAAYRNGIRTVIIPAANEKDLEEIPSEIYSEIKFIRVEEFGEVLKAALRPRRNGNKKS